MTVEEMPPCRASMAQIRQERADYGLGFQVNVLKSSNGIPFSLGSSGVCTATSWNFLAWIRRFHAHNLLTLSRLSFSPLATARSMPCEGIQFTPLEAYAASERKKNHSKYFEGLQTENQGYNLAVTVSCVPHSVDSGT